MSQRIYTFRDLMQRLINKDWSVAAIGQEFFFVPRTYIPRREK